MHGLQDEEEGVTRSHRVGGEPAVIDACRAGGLAWLRAIDAIKRQSEQLARECFRPLYAQIGWRWPFGEEGRPAPPPEDGAG